MPYANLDHDAPAQPSLHKYSIHLSSFSCTVLHRNAAVLCALYVCVSQCRCVLCMCACHSVAVCFVCLRVTVSLCALYVCLRVTVLLCALYVCVSQCLGRGPPKTLQRLPLYLYHLLPVCRTPSFKFQNKMPFVKYSGAASFACSVNIVTK